MADFKKKKPSSSISQSIENKQANLKLKDEHFRVSFAHLDKTQRNCSSFKDWQDCGLLSKTLETIQGYCCSTLDSQIDGDKFTVYGGFPPKGYTRLEHPQHVPEDAQWARIHITGAAILAGHVLGNTFYVVFLDKYHNFYLTKRNRKKFFGSENPK